MGSIVAVILRIMPESPDVDLEAIKSESEGFLMEKGAKNVSFEEKNVAFGLKAVIVKFAWPEEQDTSIFEDGLAKIEGVSSAATEDYRRAFG